ncbi:MAG: hypothetical protein ACYDFT_06875 [Thermoplasmata archaeon]
MPRPSYLLEISVERVEEPEGGSAPLRVRLVARLPVEADGEFPREEVGRLLREIRSEMDRAIPPKSAGPPGPDRPLRELLEAYRPRQPELIDLLRDEGELREGEYWLLKAHLAAPGSVAPGVAPLPLRPAELPAPSTLAAAPAGAEPVGPARPVVELLERYQITSIRQAGAVRARRQISFDEYMALKRHFGPSTGDPSGH